MIFDKRFTIKYGFIFLLISLVALLIIPAYWEGSNEGTATGFFLTTVLMSFLLLVAKKPWELIIGSILAIPVLTLNWAGILPDEGSTYFYLVNLNILFYLFVVFELIRFLVHNKTVDFNIIAASICLYFILGLVWALIYTAIELKTPGAILSNEVINSPEAFSRLLYFSFVTMTTLGYGDILPTTTIAQNWVVLQSVTGQFFLSILVARLVALYKTPVQE